MRGFARMTYCTIRTKIDDLTHDQFRLEKQNSRADANYETLS